MQICKLYSILKYKYNLNKILKSGSKELFFKEIADDDVADVGEHSPKHSKVIVHRHRIRDIFTSCNFINFYMNFIEDTKHILSFFSTKPPLM